MQCHCKLERAGTAPGGWVYDENVIASDHVRKENQAGKKYILIGHASPLTVQYVSKTVQTIFH
jgi:hypothetical protein